MNLSVVGLAILSYLSGGIPSGYLIARRAKGIDIREHGSGNPGAANVYRVVGLRAGWLTLALDALKGYVPVMIARSLFPASPGLVAACGGLAIIGHIWTVFLGFRGGKGVATSCGVFAALLPVPTLLAFMVFVAVVAWSGHISAGSMTGAALLPAFSAALGEPRLFTALAAASGALILYKHIPNMRRLWLEREPAFDEGGLRTLPPGVGAVRSRPAARSGR